VPAATRTSPITAISRRPFERCAPAGERGATAGRPLAAVIAEGAIAVIPTDTVYGVCCDAQNAAAAKRLADLKGRSSGKPAAVAFFALEAALAALPELGARTRAALCALLPGPLTLLVANPARRFPCAGGELLGVRVIDAPLEPGRRSC